MKADKRGRHMYQSQETFCKEAIAEAKEAMKENESATRVFIPETHHE